MLDVAAIENLEQIQCCTYNVSNNTRAVVYQNRFIYIVGANDTYLIDATTNIITLAPDIILNPVVTKAAVICLTWHLNIGYLVD